MTVRPFALATAGLLVLASPLATSAFATSAVAATTTSSQGAPAVSAGNDAGLFGSADPTYDGVYRQSLSILALEAAGQQPNASAVSWLLSQQCADGAFEAYRVNIDAACTKVAEDENATALAIQALVALGKPTTTAVNALKTFQLTDGGFYGSAAFGVPASDADSTGLAESALVAAGIDPTTVTASSGKSAVDFLRSVQLPCSATTGAGSYDYQPEATLHANDLATVQATLGIVAKALPVAAGTTSAALPTCPTSIVDAPSSSAAAVSYLAARLTATAGAIPSSVGSGTDWTSTANAVIDLVAAGTGSAAIATTLTALETNAAAYVGKPGSYTPGSLATLILAAHAAGVDPTAFGGLDLVTALASTERLAAAPVTKSSTPSSSGSTAGSAATPAPAPAPVATLPMTGAANTSELTWLAFSLIGAGMIALIAGRRRADLRRS